MSHSDIHLLDLPNEMLFTILEKLNNVDVLYSLFGIDNKRLGSLAQDHVFTHKLNFVSTSSVHDICPVTDLVLDRFCLDILPRIHHNIKCLVLEPLSMERILLAGTYSNLSEIQLFKFRQEFVGRYFTNDSPFRHIFKHQIKDLILINTDEYIRQSSLEDYTMNVYAYILTFFENLTNLSIMESSITDYPFLTLVHLPSTVFSSSILTKLCINVLTFNDCMLLLDGRLCQLTTFIVRIKKIDFFGFSGGQGNDLPNLKCFSLTCYSITNEYDHQVVPLLRRMLNLEKLTLYIIARDRNGFIDGTHLQNEILVYKPRLHTFIFYLSTKNVINVPVKFLSSADVQQTFIDIGYHQVGCIVEYLAFARALCHVYSLPFKFDRLIHITNKFPNNVFDRVTHLMVYDIFAFKHEFFVRLTRAFPLLRYLTLFNLTPQSWDLLPFPLVHDDNESYSVVEYPYLTSLDITQANNTYIEQFLLETKAHVPCLTELKIEYEQLKTVTKNFTRDETRCNCANIKSLIIYQTVVYSEDFYLYFPSM